LPLVSDAEMSRLFGPELGSGVAEMDDFNRREQVCDRCGGNCCRLVSCELYTPGLKSCPVQKMRPLLCRLHFCHSFARVFPILVKECGDIYLDSLIAAHAAGSKAIPLFDSPPLGKVAPEMVRAVSGILAEFRAGRLDEAGALRLIEAGLESGAAG
jgi:hypothetical protein